MIFNKNKIKKFKHFSNDVKLIDTTEGDFNIQLNDEDYEKFKEELNGESNFLKGCLLVFFVLIFIILSIFFL